MCLEVEQVVAALRQSSCVLLDEILLNLIYTIRQKRRSSVDIIIQRLHRSDGSTRLGPVIRLRDTGYSSPVTCDKVARLLTDLGHEQGILALVALL